MVLFHLIYKIDFENGLFQSFQAPKSIRFHDHEMLLGFVSTEINFTKRFLRQGLRHTAAATQVKVLVQDCGHETSLHFAIS